MAKKTAKSDFHYGMSMDLLNQVSFSELTGKNGAFGFLIGALTHAVLHLSGIIEEKNKGESSSKGTAAK